MEACARLIGFFPEYAEGELPPLESGRVSVHLGECAACNQRIKRQREILAALDRLPQVVPPNHFFESLMSRVAAAPLPVRISRRHHLRLVKAVVWIGLAGGVGAAGRLGAAHLGMGFADRMGPLLDPSVFADQIQNMGRMAFSLLLEIATKTQMPALFQAPHSPLAWGGVASVLLLSGLAAAAVGIGVVATARVFLGHRGR